MAGGVFRRAGAGGGEVGGESALLGRGADAGGTGPAATGGAFRAAIRIRIGAGKGAGGSDGARSPQGIAGEDRSDREPARADSSWWNRRYRRRTTRPAAGRGVAADLRSVRGLQRAAAKP